MGTLVSKSLPAGVLAVLNHDDDVLRYWLFEDGALVDAYNSAPDYFEGLAEEWGLPTEAAQPATADGVQQDGDAERLSTFARKPGSAAQLEPILRNPDYTFAFERHMALLDLLGLPHSAVGYGYRTLAEGEFPDDISPESILHVP